jgi:predicted GNAT family acetyltransferase
MGVSIFDVTEAELPRVRDFLRRHVETSMFLLSNLKDHGPALSEAMNSGNFRYLAEGDRIEAVFCLTRRGNILAESGGRTDCAETITQACLNEALPIAGVVGEWRLADAIWQMLVGQRAITRIAHASREPLYRLDLDNAPDRGSGPAVRHLLAADFSHWEPLNTAYMHEEHLPVQGSLEERRTSFGEAAEAGRWWGLWENRSLVAIGGLNAVYERMGQVGGVYTIPARRQSGLATAVMRTLLADCVGELELEKLMLFTGEENFAARRLYEALGFSRIGEFALLFGTGEPGTP